MFDAGVIRGSGSRRLRLPVRALAVGLPVGAGYRTRSGRTEGVEPPQIVGEAGHCEGDGVARLIKAGDAGQPVAAFERAEQLLDRPPAPRKSVVAR